MRNRLSSSAPQLSTTGTPGQIDPSMMTRVLTDMHSASAKVARIASNTPYASGAALGSVTFTSGQTLRISHPLGRTPTKWTTDDITGAAGSFYRTDWDSSSITIYSANACTATFRVE